MQKRSDISRTCATSTSLLPVLFPLIGLVGLMTATNLKEATRFVFHRAIAPSELCRSIIGENQVNSSESTFASYQDVANLVVAGRDELALARIRSLCYAPVRADGDSFRSLALNGYSPLVLMLGLANWMNLRARDRAEAGDIPHARQYAAQMRQIGDQFLNSPSPTVNGIKIAHQYHAVAVDLDIWLDEKMSRKTIFSRRHEMSALKSLWEDHIEPELFGSDGKPDAASLSRVSREYANEWVRIQMR